MLKREGRFYKSINDMGISLISDLNVDTNTLIVISGGSSLNLLYEGIQQKLSKAKVILCDERITDDKYYSNRATLKMHINGFHCKLFECMTASELEQNIKEINCRFQNLITHCTKRVGLISIGEDGHICSLFTDAKSCNKTDYIVETRKPDDDISRLGLSFKALNSLDEIHFFTVGKRKKSIVENSQEFLKTMAFKFLKQTKVNYKIHICLT